MTVGVIMLVHTAFDRAEAVARYWSAADVPVVIHVDLAAPKARVKRFARALADQPDIVVQRRYRCDWGGWGLVAATQWAARTLLDRFDVRHVYLTSGACLPIQPVDSLRAYLDQHPDTDFIESVSVADVPWTVDGLNTERFSLYFPVSWRRHRAVFDLLVSVQRRLGVSRRMPASVIPHMGSQWWCLTRATLEAMLNSPERRAFDRFFRRVWIPDESYFQTLARRFSARIESRSLTLSTFDHQGKPHVLYDDHLPLLRRSDCFVARKVWPGAEKLYGAFLGPPVESAFRATPNPAELREYFAAARTQRVKGRAGLIMQSRFPAPRYAGPRTAAPYCVLHGLDDLYPRLKPWLADHARAQVHGHLFARDRVQFANDAPGFDGALTDHAGLRDANPWAFLTNVLRAAGRDMPVFLTSASDTLAVFSDIAKDPNARVFAVTGAWTVPLSLILNPDSAGRVAVPETAARLQRAEAAMVKLLDAPGARATVQMQTLADHIADPAPMLDAILGGLGRAADLAPADPLAPRDLSRLPTYLRDLRNAGLLPYLAGDAGAAVKPNDARPQPQSVAR